MSNFDLSAIALAMVCPTNKLLTDDKGLPGAYVYRPKKMLSELLAGGDASVVHPAFMVNEVQQDGIYIGKFQGKAHNNRIYSLPGEDPTATITLDTYEEYCKNKGRGHHCITAAEWAYLALLAKKLGKQPKGNNNYGKDTTETDYVAIQTYIYNGQTGRVATGTGPLTWSDTGDLSGIWDLDGNVWEWCAGIRLVAGELQVIPFNNAASPDVDTGAASNAWRALNANASSYADLFVVPNGEGTTAGTVKLDYVTDHWQWGISINSKVDSSRNAPFGNTTFNGLSNFCKMYLQALALGPEDGSKPEDYNDDRFYANNAQAERCAARGGSFYHGVHAGVFALGFSSPRSSSGVGIGGRPAFVKLETEN